jgi:hypothetical protein
MERDMNLQEMLKLVAILKKKTSRKKMIMVKDKDEKDEKVGGIH